MSQESPGPESIDIRSLAAIRYGPTDGLVTAVVQDAASERVLMVGHMDAEALGATLRTGDVHFHSRSRDRLWRKGETSGNVLRLRAIAVDCDGDALLVTAVPAGPTCHRGTASCFDDPADGATGHRAEASDEPNAAAATSRPSAAGPDLGDPPGFGWLDTLWATIVARAEDRPVGSYTTSLLDGGVDAVARKVSEEATEVLIAAKDDALATGADQVETRSALAGEVADLVYHLLVLLAERELPPDLVLDVLRARHRG